jgi:hypothetical protein
MNTTPTEEPILKTDVIGRIRTPLARREQVLDEFEKSGLSGQEFAKLAGIKYSTFATWVQRRRRARGAYPKVKAPIQAINQVRWLEAVVGESGSGQGRPLALELPGGVKMVIEDMRQAAVAAALLRALVKPC